MPNLTSIYGGNLTILSEPARYCTVELCDLTLANVQYIPDMAGNSLYTALFSIFIIAQVILAIRYRTWGFPVAICGGLALEIIGYAGRLMMSSNPFNRDAFLIYLICLTIGPAFIAAAIYLCLSRIIVVYGEQASRLRPATYTILFCGCDFFSLLLQAVGGAIAAIANDRSTVDLGVNIMLAGLSVQVASLFLFASLCADFAWRVRKNPQLRSIKHATLTSSRPFKAFLISLGVATLTIFIRSVFRVAELSAGFDGPLANDQVSFMILEGAMIVIACACLTALHPGIAFQGAWTEANFNIRKRKTAGDAEKSQQGSPMDTPSVATP